MKRPNRRRTGYTLIELMVVVAIVGVLAAVAIPSFVNYVQRSRTTEVFSMIAEIRQRQEAYRAEFGQYCGPLPWNPAAYGSDSVKIAWTPNNGNWVQLGVSPDGPVRFQYQVLAGDPGTASPVPGMTGQDFWYVVQAQGDLDGDGDLVGFEAHSMGSAVYISQGIGGAYLASGWE